MSDKMALGIDVEISNDGDNPAVDIDIEERVLTLRSGATVPITEVHELRPGLWGYMAGPTEQGTWLVGQAQFPDDTGIN